MNEETTAATEAAETIATVEETTPATETTAPVITEPEEETTETTVETVPEDFWTYPEDTVPTETVEVVEVMDYTPVVENSTEILANVILCAALIVVGFLAAIKFWGAK